MKGKKLKIQKEGVKELQQSIHMLPISKVNVVEPLKIKVAVSQQQSEQNLAMEEWYKVWFVAHQ